MVFIPRKIGVIVIDEGDKLEISNSICLAVAGEM